MGAIFDEAVERKMTAIRSCHTSRTDQTADETRNRKVEPSSMPTATLAYDTDDAFYYDN
jgi:hypothetical protein